MSKRRKRERMQTPRRVECTYCGKPASLVKGTEIYGDRSHLNGLFYRCAPCDAHVGCHDGTNKPLGPLANAELRRWRHNCHAFFDPFWQQGSMRRKQAYRWMAQVMGIPREEAHIGMFDVEKCRKFWKLCYERREGINHG